MNRYPIGTRKTKSWQAKGWRTIESLEPRRLLAGDLVAGDANQDYRFDEADFIQAFKAIKFETSQSATWAEGDWNGAPGGMAGAPPVGDGEFNSSDFVVAFASGAYMQGPYSEDPGPAKNELAPVTSGEKTPVRAFYESVSGKLRIESDVALSTLHLSSAEKVFLGVTQWELSAERPADLPGLFDVYTNASIFRLDPSGFSTLEFDELDSGPVIQPGLSHEFLVNDLRVDGSFLSGGGIGAVNFNCIDCLDGDPASATGQVFVDTNRNGMQDEGEHGLDDLPLQLESLDSGFARHLSTASVDLNEDGNIDPFTESGQYSAAALPPGNYRLTFVGSDTDWLRTNHPDGVEFAVAEGEKLALPSIGISGIVPGAIDVSAFRDQNGNGQRDAGEPGLTDVGIRARLVNGPQIAFGATMPIDVNLDGTVDPETEIGRFVVANLAIGEYEALAFPPTNDWTPTTDTTAIVTVTEGQTAHLEFGFQPPELGTVQGQVFHDENSNGRRDPGETGIEGVRIDVSNGRRSYVAFSENVDLDSDGTINPESETGIYSIRDAVAGDYSIRQSLPSRWVAIAPADGTAAISVQKDETTNVDFANFLPVLGDFNIDQVADVQDIDLLCSTLRSGVYNAAFDLDGNQRLSQHDLHWLIDRVFETTAGDANLDKQFDSSDLVAVWQGNEYEDDIAGNSTWAEGDWNCDGEFDAFDLIAAFRAGKYAQAAKPIRAPIAATAVNKFGFAAAVLVLDDDDDSMMKRK